jgi:hypothetical protein
MEQNRRQYCGYNGYKRTGKCCILNWLRRAYVQSVCRILFMLNRDSVVSIANPGRVKIFLFSTAFRPALGVKRSRREVDN